MSDSLWQRFQDYLFHDEALGFTLDISRMKFDAAFLERMSEPMQRAFDAMEALEGGALANPDEGRMVGHYWLRAPEKAPNDQLRDEIIETLNKIRDFAADIHGAKIRGQNDEPFSHVLLVGIGGSALGPQLVADALGRGEDLMRLWFMDNTDPDGISRTLRELNGQLDRTLVLVVSKSGGTAETRNGMIETQAAYRRAGLEFAKHAVAVTTEGSRLFEQAESENWINIFPMWDWVGGRTSITSAVGILPAALQGIDIDQFLAGAQAMDALTRTRDIKRNPSALLALMWHWAGEGRGLKDMVVLPYKDRLVLMSKYLQQLVMESLGKEKDLEGKVVHQGLVVYGNKGSTDQHAYVQQLREGPNNFFVTFIEVLCDEAGSELLDSPEVAPEAVTGDFLEGFYLGTRAALYEKDRESMTISLRKLEPLSLGMLIALFERAVGFYASLIGINAYHQPGVEAGKKAAGGVLELQRKLLEALVDHTQAKTAEGWAESIGAVDQVETIYKLLERLSANVDRGIERTIESDQSDQPTTALFRRI